MSTADRKPWETSTTLDQTFLNNCADNLCCALEMVAEIELPNRTIYASDRNKYVGERFYEALVKFPETNRTIGDWLQNELEFSTLQLELSNVDGRFNDLLPGGDNFSGLAGKTLTIKLGLRDVVTTYRTIWKGNITEIGGIKRNIQTITIIARDDYDRLNINIPTATFNSTDFIGLEDDKIGTFIPFILGNWATDLITSPAVPAIVANGTIAILHTDNIYCVISSNALTAFDNTSVILKRGENIFSISSTDIESISVNYNSFQIVQNGDTLIDGEAFQYESGDEFYCLVQNNVMGDNIVNQAKYMLKQFGGMIDSDFDPNWATYAAKATPAQSAIANFKSRVWLREPQSLISYVRSMLQQVRLELFVTLDRKLKLFAMHYEEFISSPTLNIRNHDVEKNSFSLYLDDRNQVNRLQGSFGYEPILNGESKATVFYRNDASILQLSKTISKKLIFPNLYILADVEYQVQEILKLTSAFFEYSNFTCTWRMLLVELGDFLSLQVNIGATALASTPLLIRNISYDPDGIKVKITGFSLQMFPYGTWNPEYSGIVSGASAVLTKE